MLDILCVGPQWRGSNAGGLFRAFSRQGCKIDIVDEFYEIPLRANSIVPKVIARLSRESFVKEYNQRVLDRVNIFKPQVILVYKGAFIRPATLSYLKDKGYFLVNFYPDVSFHTHGSLLKKTLPLYDIVFTTKTFGQTDMKDQLGVTESAFIPHGFDPDIHRPVRNNPGHFKCDVSFIGTWSAKKEHYLAAVVRAIPQIHLNIWGSQWERSNLPKKHLRHNTVEGDLYALAISSSKINLSLLSEQVKGASSGDLITSRTFHIPGAGGFMLHERTSEVIKYFVENEEMDCFSDEIELIERVKYYLDNPVKRAEIAHCGHERACREHKLDHRALKLLEIIRERL